MCVLSQSRDGPPAAPSHVNVGIEPRRNLLSATSYVPDPVPSLFSVLQPCTQRPAARPDNRDVARSRHLGFAVSEPALLDAL